ncbi:MAG: DHH family phosphoesterase [Caldilineaceae bacterium]|nr:DHH family phosphoesterase [Caldilineaceae bacterium]
MTPNASLLKQGDTCGHEGVPPPPLLLSLLESSHNILCVSHVSPDGDAVGSLLGLGAILRSLGKRPTLALQDEAMSEFQFMPGVENIIGPAEVAHNYDLIVCLDTSSIDRIGTVYRPDIHNQIPLAVIDHHVTNTLFGTENWVDTGCAATCQMLVRLADALNVPLSEEIAVSLLTGLVTDTLCFRTANTNTNVMQTTLQLLNAGASLDYIVRNTLDSRSFSLVKLWGAGLANVQIEDGIIWATLNAESRQRSGVEPHQSDGLANFLVTVREADISATFAQRYAKNGQELVECSFRAKPGFNVSQVAFSFGGGGHPPAAGCTVAGTLQEVSARVVEALHELRRQSIDGESG